MTKKKNNTQLNKTYVAIGGLTVALLLLLNSEYGLTNRFREAFMRNNEDFQNNIAPTPTSDSGFPGEFPMKFDEQTRILSTTQITHANNPNRTIKFSIKVLPNWTIERAVQTNETFRLELKNGEYNILASYGFPEEGATCYFPGDKVPEPRTGYQLVLGDFTSIDTSLGTLRVARRLENYTSYEGETFSVCKMNQYNEWSPYLFLISSPKNYSQQKVNEAVEIIKSASLE